MLHYVKPAEGLRIIDPVRRDRLLPGSWRPVEMTPYWYRMYRDGSVSMRTDLLPEDREAETAAEPGKLPETTPAGLKPMAPKAEPVVINVSAADKAAVREKGIV